MARDGCAVARARRAEAVAGHGRVDLQQRSPGCLSVAGEAHPDGVVVPRHGLHDQLGRRRHRQAQRRRPVGPSRGAHDGRRLLAWSPAVAATARSAAARGAAGLVAAGGTRPVVLTLRQPAEVIRRRCPLSRAYRLADRAVHRARRAIAVPCVQLQLRAGCPCVWREAHPHAVAVGAQEGGRKSRRRRLPGIGLHDDLDLDGVGVAIGGVGVGVAHREREDVLQVGPAIIDGGALEAVRGTVESQHGRQARLAQGVREVTVAARGRWERLRSRDAPFELDGDRLKVIVVVVLEFRLAVGARHVHRVGADRPAVLDGHRNRGGCGDGQRDLSTFNSVAVDRHRRVVVHCIGRHGRRRDTGANGDVVGRRSRAEGEHRVGEREGPEPYIARDQPQLVRSGHGAPADARRTDDRRAAAAHRYRGVGCTHVGSCGRVIRRADIAGTGHRGRRDGRRPLKIVDSKSIVSPIRVERELRAGHGQRLELRPFPEASGDVRVRLDIPQRALIGCAGRAGAAPLLALIPEVLPRCGYSPGGAVVDRLGLQGMEGRTVDR